MAILAEMAGPKRSRRHNEHTVLDMGTGRSWNPKRLAQSYPQIRILLEASLHKSPQNRLIPRLIERREAVSLRI
jgi:hypothetical protein